MAGKQQSKKRGPRATVVFKTGQGQGKGAKTQYVYMLRSVAEKLGFEIKQNATITRKPAKSGGKEVKVRVRGSVGAKHIKVPTPGTDSRGATSKGVKVKWLSIPVPASANLSDIEKFLATAKKKIEKYITPDGQVIDLNTTANK